MTKNRNIRLLERYLKQPFSPENPVHRSAVGYLEGWLSIGINLILFAIKLTLGIISSSIGLIADAFHSLADMSTSAVILIGFRISKKPADREHPLGHQRAEAIATIVIATLLFVTGLEIGKSSVARILHPTIFTSQWWIIGAIFVTAIIKEWLARFSEGLGALIQSEALKADAWHHRSDAIATLLVLISFILARYNIHFLDGFVGLAVSLLIMYTGYDVARNSVNQILGPAPDQTYLQKVHNIAEGFPLVGNVHDITLHQYGNKKFLTMDIELREDASLEEAHEIAEQIAAKIQTDLGTYATVHVDPAKSLGHDIFKIGQFIQQLINSDGRLISFHDFETSGSPSDLFLRFDVVVDASLTDQQREKLREEICAKVRNAFPNIKKVHLRLEPSYAFH